MIWEQNSGESKGENSLLGKMAPTGENARVEGNIKQMKLTSREKN
jgi:hypothetical protein